MATQTNLEWVQRLPASELAPLLVKEVSDPVSSFGVSEAEEWSFSVDKKYYITSDQICFDDYKKACLHEEAWLGFKRQGKDG